MDTQSLYLPARRRHTRIDYRQLLESAIGTRKPGSMTAFVVDIAGIQSAAFIRALRDLGYHVRIKAAAKNDLDTAWTEGLDDAIREAGRKYGRVVVATHRPGLAPALADTGAVLMCFPEDALERLRTSASSVIPIEGPLLVSME